MKDTEYTFAVARIRANETHLDVYKRQVYDRAARGDAYR